jgi:ABC-2 type transport system permease protein
MAHTDVSLDAAGELHAPTAADQAVRTMLPMVPGHSGPVVRDLRTIRVLWHREVIRFGRNRLQVVMGLLTPLMFLLILGSGLGAAAESLRSFQTFLFPGVLLMAVQAPALAVGASIVWDRQVGFLRQMLVAPVRRGALLAGTCLGGATTGAGYGVLVLILAGVVGVPYRPQLLLVLLELALTAGTFTALGVLGAVWIKRIETFQIAAGLAMMPLLFLSGAVFPARGLPGWLGVAVLANPLTYAVDAVRRSLPGDGADLGGLAVSPQWWGHTPPLVVELAIVALMAVLALAIATHRFTRAE